jgi:hypothetical protein
MALRNRLVADKTIIWVTPTKVNTVLAPWAGRSSYSIADYAAVMKEVAAFFGDYLVDAHEIPNWLSYVTQDGIHANDRGYQVYANLIAPTIRQAIKERTQSNRKYYEDDLQSAGYPLITEVDGRVFDIKLYKSIDPAVLSSLYTGYKLWTAKSFNGDWQVYRAYQQNNQILSAELDNNDRFVITCSEPHNLAIADLIAIRNFDTLLDGFYQVFSVDEYSVTVYGDSTITQYLIDNTLSELSGELFEFQPLRFSSYTDLLNYSPRQPWVDQSYYSVRGIENANSCFTMYEFAKKFSALYQKDATDFQEKAWNLVPLYIENYAYSVNINGSQV